MKKTSTLVGSFVLALGVLIGPAAPTSAGPSHQVLCERVGQGKIPEGVVFVHWGCEVTDAPASGKERLIRIADQTGACPRAYFLEIGWDLPEPVGRHVFLICNLTG